MIGTSIATPVLAIVIVSGHCLVRLGLRTILENGKTGHVVQMYQRMTPDILVEERQPDLFILDLETERDTIGIIKSIRESAPNGKIVLLSGGEDRERLQEAFTCGVDGVVLKVQPPEVVLAMIETLCAPTPHYVRSDRDGAVGASVGTTLELMAGSETKLSDWLDDLTEREREVIALVKEGLSNKEIAYRLSISDSTVRHHLTSIFDKVGVPNRQKLLIYAHRFHSTSHHGEFSDAVSLRR